MISSQKIISRLIGLAFVFLCSYFFPITVRAVGVAPGTIIIANAANGTRITKTVRVTRPDASGTLLFKVEKSGVGARYIELSAPTVTIPDGARYTDYNLVIAPVNAPNGSYSAAVQFLGQESRTSSTSQFGIATYEGVTASLQFSVTGEQVSSFVIGGFAPERVESSVAPTFTYMLKNDGNVDAQADTIDFVITDATGTVKLSESITSTTLPFVAPGQEKNLTVTLTNRLPPGVYFVDATFTNRGKAVYEQKKVRLEILPEGSLRQDALLEEFTLQDERVAVGVTTKGTGIFNNIGDVGVRAILYVQVKKDGVTIDTLRSAEQFVGSKKTGTFSVTFRPLDPGIYTFDAYFSYGIKETARISRTLNVASLSSSLQLPAFGWLKDWFFGCTPRFAPLILLLLLLIETYLLWRYRQQARRCEARQNSSSSDHQRGATDAHEHTATISSAMFADTPAVRTERPNQVPDSADTLRGRPLPNEDRDPFEDLSR